MTPPKLLQRKTVYESEWINLHLDRVQLPSGKIIEEYHTVEYMKEGVVVLVTNAQGEILMIQNRRYRQDQPSWEIPAGFLEKREKALEGAKREVKEETGYEATHLTYLYPYHPSNGISTEVLHICFAQVEDKAPEAFDTDEVKSVHWVKKEEVRRMIHAGEISDGCSLVPLLLYLNQIQS